MARGGVKRRNVRFIMKTLARNEVPQESGWKNGSQKEKTPGEIKKFAGGRLEITCGVQLPREEERRTRAVRRIRRGLLERHYRRERTGREG